MDYLNVCYLPVFLYKNKSAVLECLVMYLLAKLLPQLFVDFIIVMKCYHKMHFISEPECTPIRGKYSIRVDMQNDIYTNYKNREMQMNLHRRM